jgi:Lar family restriction alleviation protein
MSEPAPCPFCGTRGDSRLLDLWDAFDAGTIAHMHCTKCGADGPSIYSERSPDDAISKARSAWNRRRENVSA